jgi:CDP-glucose 4,6-dehydratase
LENLEITIRMSFGSIYKGKRVLITGHTGFKGAWLAEWLVALGAEVTGFALPPPSTPSLFDQLGLKTRLRHLEGDVRDLPAVRAALAASQPDFVFHLAAQPLVRLSYSQPVETYATNIMGTVNVLEAVRLAGLPCVVVAITTDKCYENKEWVHSYREEDPMGGYDPYSSSKGAAELVIASYRRSYFSAPNSPVKLASARAGNVIGGGDWALDRIVPDCIRALASGTPIPVRNKIATRPWQHVLEPLSGYLWLGACLHNSQLPAPSTQPSARSSQLLAHSSQLIAGSSAARVLGRVEIFKPYARFLACEATGLHWLELTKRADPALIKRLDKAPPVPLYALTHDGHRVSAMTPLVEAPAPPGND